MNKPILISAGDFAGINPYLLLSRIKLHNNTEFHIALDENTLLKYAQLYEMDIPENLIALKSNAAVELTVRGKRNPETAKAAAISLNECTDIMINEQERYAALITMPVDKETIAKYISDFRGHTEYLAERTHSHVAMILYSDELTVSPVTTHIAIDRVIGNLTENTLKTHIETVAYFYRNHLNKEPRITFLCINPHCSDNSLLGNADNELRKTIESIKSDFLTRGPVSADTAFMPGYMEQTDVFICPYHDQALIPFKMKSFEQGINITAGLPFIRLSPDHGPAFDLAISEDMVSSGSFERCIEFVEKGA